VKQKIDDFFASIDLPPEIISKFSYIVDGKTINFCYTQPSIVSMQLAPF